jgi:hypothetical protein
MNKNTLIDKILEYEELVHDEYINKRLTFINHLKFINTKQFNQEQLTNFIADIKLIIEPIKTSTENINDYFINNNNSFTNNTSNGIIHDFQNMLLIYNILNQNQN